jgi:hypothetical protein
MNLITLAKAIAKLKFSDFISILALIISGISIFWNIYRDLILKGKIKTRVQISSLIQAGQTIGTFIDVTGVNYGPGPITCESVFIKNSLWRRWIKGEKKYGYVVPPANPFTGKLPAKLEVGEKVTMLFSHVANAFLAQKPTRVGFKDSFSRLHWATRKNLKQTIKDYSRDFPGRGGEPD